MKRLFGAAALAAFGAIQASAAFYVAGDFNGWNAGDPGYQMTDMGGGIFQYNVTGLAAVTRHEFKITQGDWGWSTPGSGNAWLYSWTDGEALITFNSNASIGDGWSPDTNRIGVDVVYANWTAVGDWQGWNNANAATAMTWQGGEVFFETTLAPGTYQYKAVGTGTWDAIGADGNSVNATTLSFTTTATQNVVRMYARPFDGSARVEVVPEPATFAVLAGALGLLARRRRR